jgi:hypothetical protein
MNDKSGPNLIACNCLFTGIGNIKVNLIADSFEAALLRLHSEDENDRFCDGFTDAGQAFRVFRTGLAAIGEVQTAAQKTSLIVPGPSLRM